MPSFQLLDKFHCPVTHPFHFQSFFSFFCICYTGYFSTMVLLVPCYSATLSSTMCAMESSSDDLFYEVPSSLRPPCQQSQAGPQPIAARPCVGSNSEDSILSSSVDSIRSSASTRSSSEREVERAARRRLLDISVGKLQSQRDHPLRKHLLVYNTIKSLQRDLELLDDEELYCSLVDDHSNGCRMEVDECPWPQPQSVRPVESAPAPAPLPPTSAPVSVSPAVSSNSWEAESSDWHQPATAPQPLNSIQEAFGSWWGCSVVSSSSSCASSSGVSSDAGGWGAPLSARGSSLVDDRSSGGASGSSSMSSIWGHLDDLESNPLGQSWLSSRELSSLFAPHLHSELLMQA